jgi:histidine triad (HIT) family protein
MGGIVAHPMADSPDCVFCAIAAGSVPAAIVLDEPDVLAFLDARPVFPGHVLVIPRPHVETLWDLEPSADAGYLAAIRRVTVAVRQALEADGAFVANNNVVSQSVPHLHFHVVPRRRKDGLRGFFWPRQKYAEGEMDQVAADIRAALSS